ncbi:MAG: type II secretion system protein N [Planctomycetota bacterium]
MTSSPASTLTWGLAAAIIAVGVAGSFWMFRPIENQPIGLDEQRPVIQEQTESQQSVAPPPSLAGRQFQGRVVKSKPIEETETQPAPKVTQSFAIELVGTILDRKAPTAILRNSSGETAIAQIGEELTLGSTPIRVTKIASGQVTIETRGDRKTLTITRDTGSDSESDRIDYSKAESLFGAEFSDEGQASPDGSSMMGGGRMR